ncbi:MAG: alpha/beta hydrolase [Taibaiella sp.]|nr:alpha/beta hydrolase [Taibaiella sp.]
MDSKKLHYTTCGAGQAVVLIHGFPDDGSIWAGISGALGERYMVFTPDLPGAGSSPLNGSVSLARMAAGIKDMLDANGVSRAVIVGHSMGGYVALAFARQFPECIAGLSLVHSTPLPDDEEKKKTRQKAIDLILNGGKEAFIRQMTGNLFAPKFRDEHPELMREKAAKSSEISADALVNFYRAMMERENNVEVVSNADFPVQWIMGAEDNVISFRTGLGLCHSSAVNFVHLYHGCGHMSMLECPELLAADLGQFADYCFRNP